MTYVIAQLSDVHIGRRRGGTGERFAQTIDEINAMSRQPDLVLVTGDLTETGEPAEWAEFNRSIDALRAPWEAIRGNHDRGIEPLAGHRGTDAGPLHLVLVDSSSDEFTVDDADWLDGHLRGHAERPTVIAIHHPPFESGIWWMDCVGLRGADRFEEVVRRHHQVRHVMSGHVHRPISTNWAGCMLTVCPSTAASVAGDLDPEHDPAETAEPPMIAVHAYVGDTVVSHVIPAGASASRVSIAEVAPAFVTWARAQQANRPSAFGAAEHEVV